MKNFTHELKNIMTEDPGVPIMSPDELRARSQTIVLLTNSAPDELLALAGPDRKATLLSVDPPLITLPYQKGVFKVRPEDIVFETHHTGRDVTEAGAEETPYEKFFASAMKKFGVSSPIELSPDDTKKFFNYVDKNWEAEEESDGSKNEILPALAMGAARLAGPVVRGAAKLAKPAAKAAASLIPGVDGDKDKPDKDKSNNEVDMDPAQMKGIADKEMAAATKRIATKLAKPVVGDMKAAAEAEEESDKSNNEIAPLALAIPAAKMAATHFATSKALDMATGKKDKPAPAADKAEDVSTGKVGKKDKGSYQHAYKLALKKYQIHSADELDTPEERKGFTDYVDRLWKKGDIHRDKKEGSIDQTEWVGTALKLGVAGAKALAKSKGARKAVKGAAQGVKKMATSDTTKRLAKKGTAAAAQGVKKFAGSKEGKRMKKKFAKAAEKRGVEMISGFGKKKEKPVPSETKEASIPEGVKKTPGVSKKARGAVGFAKHARKGTGAKRQFQKGVRQAGKKQASNEVLYQAPKSNKKTPETSWDKASDDKRAKLLQLASPRTSTKYTKLDYRELTPMLQKAIDKVFKTKKAKLEVSPPDRKHQVKGIKKHMAQKKGKDKIPKTYVDKKTGKRKETNPWALAWAQYDKYGVPSRDEKD